MNELQEAEESADHDHFYVVKVKNVCYDGHKDDYAEYEYRIADNVGDLPSQDEDLGFLGFVDDYNSEGKKCESFVCTDIRPITKGTRSYKELKRELEKEPWERTAGGI